jgi:hypothetical protein
MLKHGSILFLLAFAVLLSIAGCTPKANVSSTPTLTAPGLQAPSVPTTLPLSTPTASGSLALAPGTLGNKKSVNFVVRLSSNPTPPIRGIGTLEAVVTDANSQPINDAQVSFDLDMTTMSHGKNIVAAAPQGNGRYVGQVRFMMPGPWRAITVVERPGQPAEQVRFDFNVNFR